LSFEATLFGSFHLLVLLKLVLSAVTGAIIGFERETHGRPAGIRTHLLVAVGACLMMIVSETFFLKYDQFGSDTILRLDPARAAAQIISGIGFIGGGVILKEGLSVRGLTTAASLWLTAGLGMTVGIGLFVPAGIAAGLGLFSLYTLKIVENFIKKERFLYFTVIAHERPGLYENLEELFAKKKLRVSDLSADYDLESGEIRYDLVLTKHFHRMGRELITEVSALEGVKKVRFR